TQIVEGSGDISYDPNTKQFSGLIDLGTLPTGSYDIKIHTSKYLKKLLPRQVITTGTTTQMPITTLLVGDVNNDNILDILDYQLMSKQPCFGSSSPFVGGCGEGDINDDNAIGIVDLNYLLSNFGKQHGD
ncbi:MAG: hypothetical protein HYT10_03205, partial [Candidatus Levybacteria bacterium]|nr:hypothetical protein [Candidatus Levybacteria bacterium]